MPYAIGDIHGHADQLDHAMALIEADGAGGPVVFLGDYTDRGPDSRGVLDRLVQLRGPDRIALLGNHDRMFLRAVRYGFVHDPDLGGRMTWLHPALGGGRTLASYGVPVPADDELSDVHERPGQLTDLLAAAREAVPPAHLDFLEDLPTMHVTEDQVFVHAGIRPGIPLDRQDEDDLVWIREPFLSDRRDHGRLVVHGHTTIDRPEHHGNRLGLDTGAGFGRPITAAFVEGSRAWRLSDRGRLVIGS